MPSIEVMTACTHDSATELLDNFLAGDFSDARFASGICAKAVCLAPPVPTSFTTHAASSLLAHLETKTKAAPIKLNHPTLETEFDPAHRRRT
ncbi:hypothetical protein CCHR01_17564 [Colletotrichum chrysophilum]|uniref:Uncharacterized protein n=1 Tax=Colletotrichum chrysophilum TaxID=1836956 RepID=A0AAD9A1R3_9PEZI|nr:hypothetical protein CCHR01_17564 [Colletotrichum chrysophilum]